MKEIDDELLYPETKAFLCLLVLYVFIRISIVCGRENIPQSRHDMALQKLQYLSDAIQRWEMDQNEAYPYDEISPIQGKYIRKASLDPWGQEYEVNPEEGIVFSRGGCDCFRTHYVTWFGFQGISPAKATTNVARLELACDKHFITISYR